MNTDYTRDELSIVIDLIRGINTTYPLSPTMVTFGLPAVFAPTTEYPRNTKLIASAIPGRGYIGPQTFYYNRVPLSGFISPMTPVIFTITNETLKSDLLPQINQRFKINLTQQNIIDGPLPDLAGQGIFQQDIEIQAGPNSLVYIGSLPLIIAPDVIPLSQLVSNTDLSGLPII